MIRFDSLTDIVAGQEHTNFGEPGSEELVVTIPEPFIIKGNSVDVAFDGGFEILGKDVTSMRPLDVMFLIDTTGSMQDYINAVKMGIDAFVAKLESKKFDTKVGYIGFKDTVEAPVALTSVASFKASIGSLIAGGGNGINEASLGAIKSGLDYLMANGTKGALHALLLITDEPGHNGNDAAPDCTIGATVSAVNGVPKATLESLRFFHSVRMQPSVRPCSAYASARAQMDDLIGQIMPEIKDPKKRGGPLPFPFNGDVLVNDFVSSLEKTLPGEPLVCLMRQAELISDGMVLDKTEQKVDQASFEKFTAGKPYVWQNVLDAESISKLLKAKDNLVNLDVCCTPKALASKGEFGSCTQEKNLKIKFSVASK